MTPVCLSFDVVYGVAGFFLVVVFVVVVVTVHIAKVYYIEGYRKYDF